MATISTFTKELKDLKISSIITVIDRGFYSSENIMKLKNYGIIGALSSTVSIHDELILENKDIKIKEITSNMMMRPYF